MLKNSSLLRVLLLCVIGNILAISPLRQAYAQTWSPLNYWTFDGSNPLSDSMGRSALNPSYFQSTYTISQAQSGVGVNKYMTFTGAITEKYIVASNPLVLDTGFTVEMLFRAGQNMRETSQIYGRRDGSINIRIGFPFIQFGTSYIPTGSSSKTTDTWQINLNGIGRGTFGYYTDGKWHHLVFKYDAKNGIKEIWVDGQLPAGFSKTLAPGRMPANAGNSNDNVCDFNTMSNYYALIADVDEFAVYQFALPGTMVYKHYNEFLQQRHYSFSNSTAQPPAAASITAGMDINEYAPGHPNSNVDAITQLSTFPAARLKPGNTLFPNIQVFNPAHIAGWLTSSYSNAQLIQRSKDVQRELVINFNYALQVTNNTGSVSAYGDTNQFPGSWVKMANQNPSWKISANSYWPQLKPKDAGYASSNPYISCQCGPANTFLRNSSGQYIDFYGNTSSNKYYSPVAPLDSIYRDGLTQRYYLDQLTKKLTRPLDVVFENGESVPRWEQSGLTADPSVLADYNAKGLGSWQKYKGYGMNRLSKAYVDQFVSLPALSSTRFIYYQLTGHPQYAWDWSQTRSLSSQVNGQYYSSGDIYMEYPSIWRYWSADKHGWQFLIDSRAPELALGDKLYGPAVSPGWSTNEEQNVRPAQWLGFLKAVAMTGAEYFSTGYFVVSTPYQNPSNYVWQMAIPSYAQGVTSRYEDILKNGTLMPGDVPNNIISNPNQPGYSFYAGDIRKLVVIRKHNTLAKYAITGTIQPNSNQVGNTELESTASIKLDGKSLKFKVRRQGSTYIYDATNSTAPVFYQLDGWHEATHPYYWDKKFIMESELFDNTNSNVEIKTEVPSGTASGDYTNFTSYITFKAGATSVEYNFTPRGTVTPNYYVWVRARSKASATTGFSLQLDGTINHAVTCVTQGDWVWFCYNSANSTPISYSNLSLQNHKLVLTATSSSLEVDQIIVTPQSGLNYSPYAQPCSQVQVPTATISANGPLAFCQGKTVQLTANSGNNYVWSTGATTQSITASSAGNYIVTVTGTLGTATSAPTAVVVNSVPANTINATGSTTFCTGGSVTLTSTGSGTSYLWSNGATAASVIATTSGIYSVTATNSNGCSTVAPAVTVTASNSVPSTITAGGPTSFCTGGNVTLTANAGTAYQWSNGATTQSISVTTTGNYVVSVTQSGGCKTASSPVIVTAGTATAATITASGSTTICQGGSVTLTANAGSAYKWSNGATTASVNITSSGSYNVTVTQSGGCSSTSALTTVTVGNSVTAGITASGATTFCQGGSVTLIANAGTAYKWSNGATTATLSVTSSGSYNVTVTQNGGCSATSSVTTVTVNSAPTSSVTASGSTSFCNGGSVVLTSNSTSGTYRWSNGATTKSIAATSSGNYVVTATSTSGCTSVSNAVTVNANSATANITASGSLSICSGGSVTLTANSGSSYKWSTGATTSSINATTAGTYYVTVTQAAGCSAVSSGATVIVGTSGGSASVSPAGTINLCSSSPATLTASSGSSYKWSNGATTQTINVTSTGSYFVTVSQAGGCAAVSSPTQVNISPSAVFTVSQSGPLTFCNGGSVTLTVNTNNIGVAYVWYKDNVVITTASKSSLKITAPGVYLVRVQLGSCGTFSQRYTVTVPCREGEVPASSDMNFTAYPNPFTENTTFSFELTQPESVSIRILDMSGKLVDVVMNETLKEAGETHFEYNTNRLSSGIYFAEISTGDMIKRIRIVSAK